MPKQRKRAVTFNEHLGSEVESRMRKRALTQAELADAIGVSDSTMGRKIAGKFPFTLDEINGVAVAVEVSPAVMIETALAEFGGLEKLMSEAARTKDDLAARRMQKAAKKMPPAEIEERGIAAIEDDYMDAPEPEAP